MSCEFVNVMALTLSAAEELKNPILVELLSDYAKSHTNNKMQFFLIHLLAKSHIKKIKEGGVLVSKENRIMYNVIRRYLDINTAKVTKELIWAD